MDMSQVGRQDGQTALGVLARTIPPDQSLYREAVTIMPISALSPACRLPDYAESGEVALPSSPFGATFRTFLTN
jgi:hypothetical protein